MIYREAAAGLCHGAEQHRGCSGMSGGWGENVGKLLLNEGFVGLEGSAGAAVAGRCFGLWVFKGHEEVVLPSCPLERSLCVSSVPTQCHSSGGNDQNEQSQGELALPGTESELCAVTQLQRGVSVIPLPQWDLHVPLPSWESWNGLDGKRH